MLNINMSKIKSDENLVTLNGADPLIIKHFGDVGSDFEMTFKLLSNRERAVLNAQIKKETKDEVEYEEKARTTFIEKQVMGWSGIADEDDTPIEYNETNLKLLATKLESLWSLLVEVMGKDTYIIKKKS